LTAAAPTIIARLEPFGAGTPTTLKLIIRESLLRGVNM
jgi:hypothetical protein